MVKKTQNNIKIYGNKLILISYINCKHSMFDITNCISDVGQIVKEKILMSI